MTQLSPHFSLEELTYSTAAIRRGLDNTPDSVQIANLTRLCVELLEPARAILGVPFHIDSGFRSPEVNTLVGSSAKHSAHLDGRAADIVPMGGVALKNAFDALRTNLKGYDQIIIECNAWIHIAIPDALDKPRGEALIAWGAPGNWKYAQA
jgi:zinc D-Ala-D-Ala carboxypeptidase